MGQRYRKIFFHNVPIELFADTLVDQFQGFYGYRLLGVHMLEFVVVEIRVQPPSHFRTNVGVYSPYIAFGARMVHSSFMAYRQHRALHLRTGRPFHAELGLKPIRFDNLPILRFGRVIQVPARLDCGRSFKKGSYEMNECHLSKVVGYK